MSQRITVGTVTYAVASAIQRGMGAAVASIRCERAMLQRAKTLVHYDTTARGDARVAIAWRNLRSCWVADAFGIADMTNGVRDGNARPVCRTGLGQA